MTSPEQTEEQIRGGQPQAVASTTGTRPLRRARPGMSVADPLLPRLHALVAHRGLSQADLSRMSGVNRGVVSLILGGCRGFGDAGALLLEALGVTRRDLEDGGSLDGEPPSPSARPPRKPWRRRPVLEADPEARPRGPRNAYQAARVPLPLPFGHHVRDLRVARGLSRRELATSAGLSYQKVHDVEHTSRADGASTDLLLHALGTTWEGLAGRPLAHPPLLGAPSSRSAPGLPDRVRARRGGLGLTQAEVADGAGVSYARIVGRIERGLPVRDESVVRVLRFLGLDADALPPADGGGG